MSPHGAGCAGAAAPSGRYGQLDSQGCGLDIQASLQGQPDENILLIASRSLICIINLFIVYCKLLGQHYSGTGISFGRKRWNYKSLKSSHLLTDSNVENPKSELVFSFPLPAVFVFIGQLNK